MGSGVGGDGTRVGTCDGSGDRLGNIVGRSVGGHVGASVGGLVMVGSIVGIEVGTEVGDSETEGKYVGTIDGISDVVGAWLGENDGVCVGPVGRSVGTDASLLRVVVSEFRTRRGSTSSSLVFALFKSRWQYSSELKSILLSQSTLKNKSCGMPIDKRQRSTKNDMSGVSYFL
jgi:hypothetical protein